MHHQMNLFNLSSLLYSLRQQQRRLYTYTLVLTYHIYIHMCGIYALMHVIDFEGLHAHTQIIVERCLSGFEKKNIFEHLNLFSHLLHKQMNFPFFARGSKYNISII